MAKKIDLKSLDWAAVLIGAAMKTRQSYEESRGNGKLGPDLREVIRAYESESDGDEDDDLEDDDLEDDDLDPDSHSDEPTQSARAAGDQETNTELVHLRELVVILRERLAASEERLAASQDRLNTERALVESTRRDFSEREARCVTRERELMGLLSEALRGRASARVATNETTLPSPAPASDDSPAKTAPQKRQHIPEESADAVEIETDIGADVEFVEDAEVNPEIGVNIVGAGSPVFDSSKIIDVEVLAPGDSDNGTRIDDDDIDDESIPDAQAPEEARDHVAAPATEEARDDVAAPATEVDAPQEFEAAGSSSHRDHARPSQAHTPESTQLPADPLGRADAALRRGDHVEARALFETLEAKTSEFGPEGELVLVTIRRGLAESSLGLRDYQRALQVSKQALSAASTILKSAPTAVNLFNYLSSARVRGMVLLATGDPLNARTLLQRACVRADRSGIDFSPAHANELGVMVCLIQGIESSKQLQGAHKTAPGRKTQRKRKTGRARKGRGRR